MNALKEMLQIFSFTVMGVTCGGWACETYCVLAPAEEVIFSPWCQRES